LPESSGSSGEANQLLRAAEKDWRTVCQLADLNDSEDVVIGFHAQQMVEKLLKAVLVAAGRSYPLTHDLDRLIGLVAETGKDMTAYLDLGDLNPYAVELRYGLDDDQISELDRPQLLDQCFRFRVAVQCWLADLSG
jgi:HEPN domain-containing protein